MSNEPLRRCAWPTFEDPVYLTYHDLEWGVPLHNDRKISEYLVLEAFQAGLSWRTVLYKRDNFRRAFAKFDYSMRCRPRFTVRTLAIVVTLVCAYFGAWESTKWYGINWQSNSCVGEDRSPAPIIVARDELIARRYDL